MGIAGGYYAGETITPGDCTEDRIRTLFSVHICLPGVEIQTDGVCLVYTNVKKVSHLE